MKQFLCLILFLFVKFNSGQAQLDPLSKEALRECGNLHQLDFHALPNAKGEFSDKKCQLKCSIGDRLLSSDSLSEGFQCPLEQNGICHSGHCIVTNSNLEALRECGNIHRIDFHAQNSNNSATTFYDHQCALKCVFNGNLISTSSLNEGFECPGNRNGICHSGKCIEQSVNPTTIKPTTRNPKSGLQITEVRVKIISANVTSYTMENFMASACVQTSGFLGNNLASCEHCFTQAIANQHNQPEWNKLCTLKGPFEENNHFLALDLFENYNGASHYRGKYLQYLHFLIALYGDEHKHDQKQITFERKDMPILLSGSRQVGTFHAAVEMDIYRE